ncbi:hypothetical protein SPRG_11058 [Saprolegnia parasitica CBS 223.65]|uniref:MATE efflux family protein n=1 Tax=Saprolegnia parasitica (strain CBS 223.65) TaxID=695850 RepID=A0A067BWL6_SAPPC|nr:hypothetical protein SPRG_11058 [Saprolegnia parasitica CBS 223.65]KDO21205.1 hypothetical protein SPRG_11058 [Saprolegnia parasitica CBS 223.65]|eukprot:XP_012208108.1 hypothetical protein SPRG_11058 [Saprolegnia parasitica CBS 223.65]
MAEFSARHEATALARLATPILFSNLAMFGMSMAVLMAAGHLGSAQLTAVAYAQMLFDITILVFASGFISGQAALSAQAFGAGNLALVGRYCQMNCVCITLACIPIGILWWFTGDFLRAGGISDDTVRYAQEYSHYSTPWLLPRLLFQVLSVYFKSMQNVLPAAIFAVAFTVLHAGLVVVLVFGLPSTSFAGYGLLGAPLALTLTHYGRTIAYVAYMFGYKKHHASSWNWAMRGLSPRLYLMPMLRNLQLQTMAVFAAMTSEVDLGANNSMLNLIFFLTSPIFGMMDGGATRIAMHLGAGHAHAARATSHLVFYGIFGICILIVVPWLCARSSIGRIFSSDETVVQSMTTISTLAAAGYIIMSLFYYAMATLQAQARTLPIMVSFLVGAWIVGVPLAYVLDFPVDLGLLGIWIGMSVGYIVTTVLGVYFTFKSDWPEEAKKAVERSAIKCNRLEPAALEEGYAGIADSPVDVTSKEP